jgi:hypothetical protein
LWNACQKVKSDVKQKEEEDNEKKEKPGVNFANVLQAAFVCADPKSTNKD